MDWFSHVNQRARNVLAGLDESVVKDGQVVAFRVGHCLVCSSKGRRFGLENETSAPNFDELGLGACEGAEHEMALFDWSVSGVDKASATLRIYEGCRVCCEIRRQGAGQQVLAQMCNVLLRLAEASTIAADYVMQLDT